MPTGTASTAVVAACPLSPIATRSPVAANLQSRAGTLRGTDEEHPGRRIGSTRWSVRSNFWAGLSICCTRASAVQFEEGGRILGPSRAVPPPERYL